MTAVTAAGTPSTDQPVTCCDRLLVTSGGAVHDGGGDGRLLGPQARQHGSASRRNRPAVEGAVPGRHGLPVRRAHHDAGKRKSELAQRMLPPVAELMGSLARLLGVAGEPNI